MEGGKEEVKEGGKGGGREGGWREEEEDGGREKREGEISVSLRPRTPKSFLLSLIPQSPDL